MPTRDFTKKREPVIFTIGEDEYRAYTAIPAEVLAEFGTRMQGAFGGAKDLSQLDAEKQLAVYKDFLETVLEGPSFQMFCSRLTDRAHPIENSQLNEIVEWLLEVYGMRPTEPSSNSSGGSSSPESGTPSTGSTPDGESISLPSQPTGS